MLALFVACLLIWHGPEGLALLRAPEQWAIVAFFVVSLGMLAGISRHVFPAAIDDLAALDSCLDCNTATRAQLARALLRYPRAASLRLVPVAALIGIGHVLLLGQNTPVTGLWIGSMVGTLLIWQMMFQLALPLVHNARLFSLLGQACRVDLYRPERLNAFGTTAIRPCLLIIALQCAYAIFLLSEQATLSAGLLLGLGASMGLVAGLFFKPLVGIRHNIRQELARASNEVDQALTAMNAPTRPLSTPDLQRVGALLALRQHLGQISSWPLGFQGVRRMLFYLILVPLTWVGAALVEMLIDGRL